MLGKRLVLSTSVIAVVFYGAPADAQTRSLTLNEALKFARENNGTIRSAFLQVDAARARAQQAESGFYPTLTPSYRLSNSRTDVRTGRARGSQDSTTHSSELAAGWKLLDSGERSLGFSAARRSVEAQDLSALQTLRGTLFTVHQQYLDALRAQELTRVAKLQQSRADATLKQTQAQVDVGDAPAKDTLQARADALNAQVQTLIAENRHQTALSSLKSTIGWNGAEATPDLTAVGEPPKELEAITVQDAIKQGLQNRADLKSQRKRIEAQELSNRRTQLGAGVTWSLDANYVARFSPDVSQNRGLTFSVSMPLFDGGLSKATVKESRLNLEAARITLQQAERDAAAEIESAVLTYEQNRQRLLAAQAALEAARKNYEAAAESQRLGAEGTNIVTVLTAQVSLATAESNAIEAFYDFALSEVRLRLVTGRPLSGETDSP